MGNDKKQTTGVRGRHFGTRMAIALCGGVVAGLACLLAKEWLVASGRSDWWEMIYRLLFQDITSATGTNAIGVFYIIGQLFIKSLQVIIIPMLFTSLALAMQKIADMTALKRISAKTIAWFLLCYAFALALALAVGMLCYKFEIFLFNSEGIEGATGTLASNPLATIVDIIPSNIIAAFSSNSAMLSVVFVAVVCGLAMNHLGREKTSTLFHLLEEVNAIVFLVLDVVIKNCAPIGSFALITTAFASYGTDYLLSGMAYLAVSAAVLLVFLFVGCPLLIFFGMGLNPMIFMKKMMGVLVIAFSTTSSAAVLPHNLEVTTKRLGVSDEIATFVLPLGMTINMNGTAIMQVIATLFVASSGGYEVTASALVLLAILTLITSAGTPAVSGAGGIILFTILTGMGYVNSGAVLAYTLILAINKPIGMLVTALNVVSDAVACLYVAKSENSLDAAVYEDMTK